MHHRRLRDGVNCDGVASSHTSFGINTQLIIWRAGEKAAASRQGHETACLRLLLRILHSAAVQTVPRGWRCLERTALHLRGQVASTGCDPRMQNMPLAAVRGQTGVCE